METQENQGKRISRRDFLRVIIGATAATILSGCYSGVKIPTPSPTPTETPPQDPLAPQKTEQAKEKEQKKLAIEKATEEAGKISAVIFSEKNRQKLPFPNKLVVVTYLTPPIASVLPQNGLNIRNFPSKEGEKIDAFPKGARFSIVGLVAWKNQVWVVSKQGPRYSFACLTLEGKEKFLEISPPNKEAIEFLIDFSNNDSFLEQINLSIKLQTLFPSPGSLRYLFEQGKNSIASQITE